ncbi:MAG: hypothetical protein WD042_15270 [Phycisphaeraceae bacterium]
MDDETAVFDDMVDTPQPGCSNSAAIIKTKTTPLYGCLPIMSMLRKAAVLGGADQFVQTAAVALQPVEAMGQKTHQSLLDRCGFAQSLWDLLRHGGCGRLVLPPSAQGGEDVGPPSN